MVNIVHVSPTYYSADSVIGGGEKYVVYVARAMQLAAKLKGSQVDVTLLAFGERPGRYAVGPEIFCDVLPGRPWDASSLDARSIRAVLKQADVVYVHQCLCAFGLFVASQARLAGSRIVGLDHGGGEHPIVHFTPEAGNIFDFFQAYSDFGANAFTDIQGKVAVIRGPVDDEYFTPSGGERIPNRVVAVGRILPHKGFDRIIRALPPGLELSIIGSRYDEAYHDYLRGVAVGKRVEFIEGLDDLALREFVRSAGLFVHASTHVDYLGRYYAKPELLGLAPLEALACGIPTLVSTAGSLAELGIVDGCVVFEDDEVLAQILEVHAQGRYDWPSKAHISADVRFKFGLEQFGREILKILEIDACD